MSLKTFTIQLQNIGKQECLRPNVGYRYFFDIQNAEVYKTKKQVRLKHVLAEMPSKKVLKGELEDEETLVDIGNIERRFNNLINCEKVSQVGSDKNILQEGDIVIPKMQPQMGNIFLNLHHNRYVGSTELLEYKISNENNPLFIYYLITSKKFLSDLSKLESGKTHRRVNSIDLLKIKIPLVDKTTQDRIVDQILPIENKIKGFKSEAKEAQEVINVVFAREFKFDLAKFEEFKQVKNYYLGLSNFGNNIDLRQSVKFHREAGAFVNSQLKRVTNKRIKDFIAEPIVLGKSVSPTDYDEDGDD